VFSAPAFVIPIPAFASKVAIGFEGAVRQEATYSVPALISGVCTIPTASRVCHSTAPLASDWRA
jgi:hypothetical protein